jgi:hypothetical protein
MDSSFNKENDNGRKLTFLYFCNLDKDNGVKNKSTIKLYKSKDNKEEFVEFDGSTDKMIMLKSRIIPYDICLPGDGHKRFIIRYWINGPADRIKFNF